MTSQVLPIPCLIPITNSNLLTAHYRSCLSLSRNLLTACHWSCLSLSFSLTCYVNTLIRTILLSCNNNNAEITSFIPVLAGWNLHMSQTLSHQRHDTRPTNCTPKDAHASVFFLYFQYSTRKTFVLVLNFEVGHFAHRFMLLSFFWCCYERN